MPPQKPQLSVVERRRKPRYHVDLPCEVVCEDGSLTRGRISDISLSGLQIKGDTVFIHVLYPNDQRPDWRTPLQIEVRFSLPGPKQIMTDVSLRCQLVYCKRGDTDLYKVGCQYLQIGQDAQQAMENFIGLYGVLKN